MDSSRGGFCSLAFGGAQSMGDLCERPGECEGRESGTVIPAPFVSATVCFSAKATALG